MKPVIEDIKIPKDKLEELKSILSQTTEPFSRTRTNAIREYAGGICCTCDEIPTKLVSYDMDGITLVEKYCDKCFKKWDKLEKRKHSV